MGMKWAVLSMTLFTAAMMAACGQTATGHRPYQSPAPHAAPAEGPYIYEHKARPSGTSGDSVKIIRLEHQNAEDVAKLLNGAYAKDASVTPGGVTPGGVTPGGVTPEKSLKGKVTVEPDTATNSIMITTDPANMDRVVELARELDVPGGSEARHERAAAFKDAYDAAGSPGFVVVAIRGGGEDGAALAIPTETAVEGTVAEVFTDAGARIIAVEPAKLAEIRASATIGALPADTGVVVRISYRTMNGSLLVKMTAISAGNMTAIAQVSNDYDLPSLDPEAGATAFMTLTARKLRGDIARKWEEKKPEQNPN
jgi:hypothetical protein